MCVSGSRTNWTSADSIARVGHTRETGRRVSRHRTNPRRHRGRAVGARANDCSSLRSHRRPLQNTRRVPRAGSRSILYAKPSNASDLSGASQTFRVTHPFHPLYGREFTLVVHRRDWGGYRAYFHDDTGRLASLPAQWTSLFPVDPFVAVSAGRSPLRVQDLLELSQLIARIRQGGAF
jgi:Family of unknown function (DUF5372)